MSITFKGREVRHPWRWPLATLIFAVVFLAMVLLVVLLPITVPGHILLRWSGRYGFFRMEDGNRGVYNIDAKAFRRIR